MNDHIEAFMITMLQILTNFIDYARNICITATYQWDPLILTIKNSQSPCERSSLQKSPKRLKFLIPKICGLSFRNVT